MRKYFAWMVENYFTTRRNKRYGRDQMQYEENWVALSVRAMRERLERSFRIRHNYTFLVSVPKWREIFATEFAGRLADHELCDTLAPFLEEELSGRTYNNRKNKGGQAAINQLIDDMCEVSCEYTKTGWVIKNDISGYFPSAVWDYAEQCITKVIEHHRKELGEIGGERGWKDGDEYVDYLLWLTMVLVHANPAAHCEMRSPRYMWREHISPEKSLLGRNEGVGAAIGRLVWQTAMGLYINDDIRWLNEEMGVRVVCFVDDIAMVVPDERKEYALSLLPELRRRLAEKGLEINGRKFYCQTIAKGVEFLGSHIRPYRIHVNNKTFGRALGRVGEINRAAIQSRHTERWVDMLLASVNSYTGLMKNRTDYKRIGILRRTIDGGWWKYVRWDAMRRCLVYKEGWGIRDRMKRRWRLTAS